MAFGHQVGYHVPNKRAPSTSDTSKVCCKGLFTQQLKNDTCYVFTQILVVDSTLGEKIVCKETSMQHVKVKSKTRNAV